MRFFFMLVVVGVVTAETGDFFLDGVNDNGPRSTTTTASDFPPTGAYAVLSAATISASLEQISLAASSAINNERSIEPISGETSQVGYTFKNFRVDSDMGPIDLTAQSPRINFGLTALRFVFVFDYRVCAKSWPNPCENGWIEIKTVHAIGVSTSGVLDVSGANVNLVFSDTLLHFSQGDVNVHVQCTDTFCLIPVGDLASAVASQFTPMFQQGVQDGLNKGCQDLVDTVATTLDSALLAMKLELDGGWAAAGDANSPNLVFFLKGEVEPDSEHSPAPFEPSVVPDMSVFTDASNSLIVSGYLLESLFWTVQLNGLLNITVTPDMVPESSPVQFTTNDETFVSVIPGLEEFPNMDITMDVSMIDYSATNITTTGIHIDNTVMRAVFRLSNDSYSHAGWVIDATTNFDLDLSVAAAGSTVKVAAAVASPSFSCRVASSEVGDMDPEFFEQMLSLAATALPSPDMEFDIPSGFTMSSASVASGEGYIRVAFDGSFVTDQKQVCSDSLLCPEQNTCCPNIGLCCILPNASCCADHGCCQQGYTCLDGKCYKNGVGNETIVIDRDSTFYF